MVDQEKLDAAKRWDASIEREIELQGKRASFFGWMSKLFMWSEAAVMGFLAMAAIRDAKEDSRLVVLGMIAAAVLTLIVTSIVHRREMAELRKRFELIYAQDRKLTHLFLEHVELHHAAGQPVVPPNESKH